MLRHIVLGAFWAALVIITLELCARLDDSLTQGAPFFGPWDISVIYEHDALGQKGKPGARFGKWKMNSLGFRGPDLTPGSVRILVIGSSETFGQYESEDMEWPRQLERLLNHATGSSGTLYEVVNTALAGETLPASLRRLQERIALTNPSAAIIYPSLVHYLWVPYLPEHPTPPPKRFWTWRIQGRMESLLKRTLPLWLQTRIREWQTERAARQFSQLLDDVPPELCVRFRRDLEKMLETLKAHGIQPLLVTHANRFGGSVRAEERDSLLAWRKFYPMLTTDGLLNSERTLNRIMREVAAEQRIPLVDAAQKMPAGPEFFADFVHFTDKGSSRFAALVADALKPCLNGRQIRCPARPGG